MVARLGKEVGRVKSRPRSALGGRHTGIKSGELPLEPEDFRSYVEYALRISGAELILLLNSGELFFDHLCSCCVEGC